MDEDLQSTRIYFDGKAAEWDERMAPKPEECRRIDSALDELGIEPSDRIIDAGCGTGVLFPYLQSRISPPGCIHALDISPEMIAAAREKHGNDDLIRYINNDVLAFARSVRGGWADKIVCFSAFPHFPNKVAVIAAFHHLLKTGGRFLIFHLHDSARINAIHAGLPDEQVRTHTLPPIKTVREHAENAGFSVVKGEDRTEGYCLLARKG